MPDIYPIVTREKPSLRERSIEVSIEEITTAKFQAHLDKLVLTMENADGIGIASPQVGINQRVVVVTLGNTKFVLVNPEITKLSPKLIESEEGCLSVPGVYGLVDRAKRITFKAIDRHGRRIEIDAKNMDAIVVQHEIDHLDGILFIDKVKTITKGKI